jgi:tripartite-type tricarboxylate transporter receptor subunit TctC
MKFRRVISSVAALVLALCAAPASVAADWPARPVRIVVPYPAGGGTDIVARMVGVKLSESLKQPVIIENKLGANGAIATDYVVKQPADGYTVLFDAQSAAITPAISKVPYDPARDLQPVAKLITQAFVIVASPKLPVKNLRDVVAHSMTRPEGLNAAVPGSGTYLTGELFKLMSNARMTFIPYKGGAPAALSLMSGETDIGFMDVPSVAGQILSGRIQALAVTTGKRVKMIPDVPTAPEAGMPDFQVEAWLGAFVPANTPAEVVARLNAEINAALASPDIVAKIEQLGGEASKLSVAEFSRYFRAEIERWKDVVVRAKVKVE